MRGGGGVGGGCENNLKGGMPKRVQKTKCGGWVGGCGKKF